MTNRVLNVGGFAGFDKEFVQIVNNVPESVAESVLVDENSALIRKPIAFSKLTLSKNNGFTSRMEPLLQTLMQRSNLRLVQLFVIVRWIPVVD